MRADFGDTLRNSGFGRRLFPRLAIDGALVVRDLTLEVNVAVEDLSAGGFRAVSPVLLHTGTRHTFEVLQPGAQPLRLVGRVVHCRGMSPGRGPYSVGWAFERDCATAASVVRLLDYVTGGTSLDVNASVPSAESMS